MPKSQDNLNNELYDLLKTRGFDPETLDSAGKEVPVADSADVFQFHYHHDGRDYGTVTITIDGLKDLIIYYNDEATGKSDASASGGWFDFVKQMKKFAHRRQLGFKLKDIDRLGNDMKKRTYTKKMDESVGWLEDALNESSEAKLQTYKRASAGDAINRQNIANRTGVADPMIAKRNAGQERAQKKLDKISLKELAVDGLNDAGDNRSKLLASVGRLLDSGNKVDWQVPGQMGHVTRVQDDGITMKRWKKPHSRMSFFLPMNDSSRDSKYTIKMVEPKHYAVVSAEKSVSEGKLSTMWLEQALKATESTQRVDEGYYGTKSTSYSDSTPATVKMIIKHNKSLAETDQRYRHIAKIFLETDSGARFLVPSTKPSVARSFARHIAEGGEYNDERWNHIKQITEDIGKLGGFVRATKTKQFNEGVTRIVTEATEQYRQLRETMKRLQSARGYNSYFESWTPTLLETSDDNLAEVFMSSRLDPRIESALPVLNRMNIKMQAIAEAGVFEAWADNMIDEAIFDISEDDEPDLRGQREELIDLLGPDSDELPVGPDAISAIGELDDLIDSEELNNRLKKTADADPDADARDTIRAWMREQPEGTIYAIVAKEIDQAKPGEHKAPAPVKPAKPAAKPTAKSATQPSMPPQGAATPNLPPLPPPPLAEDEVASLKRLLGM